VKKLMIFAVMMFALIALVSTAFAGETDLYNTTTNTLTLVPDTSRVTQYSEWVDNRNALYGTLFLVSIGSSDDSLRAANTIRIVLQDSTVGSASAAVTSATRYIGTMSTASTGTVALIDDVGEDSCLTQIQYVGPARYCRIAVIRAGTHIETATAVVAVQRKRSYGARN